MAFQPIVDVEAGRVFSYESLVRGNNGEPASKVLGKVSDDSRYWFDQACRVKAIKLAAELGIDCNLNINFLPNAVYKASTCIRATIAAAEKFDFPLNRIIFEITENERLVDPAHLLDIIRTYQKLGFKTAIDDFGAGYSGLNLLTEFQPDMIKLDMALIRNVDQDDVKQAVLKGLLAVADDLGCEIIAEGVERVEELDWLREQRIRLFQGFLFAPPLFEQLPKVAEEWLQRPAERAA
jgi:EAL domain-containing protein (putative c-di-GMP-specific phosphodiesterase class I)